ncbi:MAG: hypothetical protein IT281_07800 [Ignavibacteria bacterium]|nr:hypothetical protein [Ignavibacteria bacterium]
MKVLIIGRSEYLYDTAIALSKDHEVCGIVSAKTSPEFERDENDFKKLAEKLRCRFIYTTSIDKNVLKAIDSINPDIAISINWVSILNKEMIDRFRYGILNAHFGDLPAYKGNAVINWAIINGERSISISIHKMKPGIIDDGEVLMKLPMVINHTTTISEIVNFCRKNIPLMYTKVLKNIPSKYKRLPKIKNKRKNSFRCYPRLPEYSKIDWNRTAEEIHSLFRATAKPYSGAYSYIKINGSLKKVIIWETVVQDVKTKDMAVPGHIIKNDTKTGISSVFTGKGIIGLMSVQYDSGKIFMPGKKWKSIRIHFGIDVEAELISILNRMKK